MSGRDEIGRGGLLRDAWQHLLDTLADYEWARKDIYPIRDQYGYYAVVGTVLSRDMQEQLLVVLTARMVRYSGWSVTKGPWDVAQKHHGWLVGYFNDTGDILVFDPAKSTGTAWRRGEPTFEFNTSDGVPLREWLQKPQLRTRQSRL